MLKFFCMYFVFYIKNIFIFFSNEVGAVDLNGVRLGGGGANPPISQKLHNSHEFLLCTIFSFMHLWVQPKQRPTHKVCSTHWMKNPF